MKIEIDTNKDSREDIKKAIKMLQALVGEENSYGLYKSNKQPEPSPGAFNMFGDDSPIMGTDEAHNSYEEKKEPPKKEPKIQIIEY